MRRYFFIFFGFFLLIIAIRTIFDLPNISMNENTLAGLGVLAAAALVLSLAPARKTKNINRL